MDSVIPAPSLLTFSQGILYVLDNATPQIVALDAETGAYLWKAGRRGAGPEEFAGVAAMYPDRTGGVGVVDIRNRRVSTLTRDGKFSSSISTANLGQQPNQVCPFGEDRFLVADVFEPALLAVDSTGAVVSALQPLWPDLVRADWQSRQVTLRSDGMGKRCLVALSSGRGFAFLAPERDPVMGPYVEQFDVYGVGLRKDEGKMRFWATYEAGILGDTVLILFSGTTSDRGRLVDRYNARSGEYLSSDLLPFTTNRLTAGGGLLFAVDTSETKLVALRARQ